jgi:hypothetical protein
MRGITQNLIIAIVTTGFLALSASSFPIGSAAAQDYICKDSSDCPPGMHCRIDYRHHRPGEPPAGYCTDGSGARRTPVDPCQRACQGGTPKKCCICDGGIWQQGHCF